MSDILTQITDPYIAKTWELVAEVEAASGVALPAAVRRQIDLNMKFGLAHIIVHADPAVSCSAKVVGLSVDPTRRITPSGSLSITPAIVHPLFPQFHDVLQSFPPALAAAMRGHESWRQLTVDSRGLCPAAVKALLRLGFRRKGTGDPTYILDKTCICRSARQLLKLCRSPIVRIDGFDRSIIVRKGGLPLCVGAAPMWTSLAGIEEDHCLPPCGTHDR